MPDKADRKAAFSEIVSANAERVLSLALRITGDATLAQDISQDVFASAWHALGNRESVAAWPAYLRTATVRQALRYLRNRKPSSSEQLEAVVDPRPSPERTAEFRELESRVRGCLASLPEKQALAFALVKLDGLSYRECAEALSCAEATARVHAHRAMIALARMLRGDKPPARSGTNKPSITREEV